MTPGGSERGVRALEILAIVEDPDGFFGNVGEAVVGGPTRVQALGGVHGGVTSSFPDLRSAIDPVSSPPAAKRREGED
jgi:hypothetical protein